MKSANCQRCYDTPNISVRFLSEPVKPCKRGKNTEAVVCGCNVRERMFTLTHRGTLISPQQKIMTHSRGWLSFKY